MATLTASEITTLSLLYKLGKLHPAPPNTKLPSTHAGPSTMPVPSKALNDRIALHRGDITKLAVDAIVNAANRTLLGGGGVDGAIHRAAGPGLLRECKTLNGCATGSAKITAAYNLPCRKVIHAVGPVYNDLDPDASEDKLAGCYTTSLRLAKQNGCRSVAFSALSTGVYGYPSREAAPVALSTVRKFLTEEDKEGSIQKVVMVTFEMKDVKAYEEFAPMYFPPVEESAPAPSSPKKTPDETATEEAKLDEEAEAVAKNLPSAPTIDPVAKSAPLQSPKRNHDEMETETKLDAEAKTVAKVMPSMLDVGLAAESGHTGSEPLEKRAKLDHEKDEKKEAERTAPAVVKDGRDGSPGKKRGGCLGCFGK